MEPINYMLDVKNPIEEAMRGYGLGRADIEQRQIMQERQQMMGMRDTAEARAASEFEMRRAEAERQRAAAEAGQAELMRLAELGPNATTEDYTRAFVANPGIRQDLSSLRTMFEAPKLETMLRTSQDLYAAARMGNIDAVRNQLTVQLEAAKNSGDEGMAATYGSALEQLNTNPEMGLNAIAATSAFTMMELKGPEYVAGIDKALGVGGDEATEAFRTLQLRAEAAGLVKGTPEYNQFMVSGGKAPEGMTLESDGAGGFRLVQGVGAASAKPFTEGQSKDVVFATRAKGALEVLEPVANELTSLTGRGADYDPTGLIRGRVQSPEYQVAKQSGDEFLQAILRKDTGAAITRDEQFLYGGTYLPQPGDGPAVLDAKRAARQRAVAAIEAGMSPAQMLAQEKALSGSGGATDNQGLSAEDLKYLGLE
jgi:hypothetical protein